MATSGQNSSFSTTAIYDSAPHSPSLHNQVEENDDYDFVGAKDAATNGPIDWDFGRAETDEFLRRRRGRKSLPIVHHHGFVCEIPPNHRFVMGKFDGLYNYLMMDGVVEKEQVVIGVWCLIFYYFVKLLYCLYGKMLLNYCIVC